MRGEKVSLILVSLGVPRLLTSIAGSGQSETQNSDLLIASLMG